MRVRWWQSLRWRLAFGSVLLALLTTSSLALTAIWVINNYYGVEQKKNLSQYANDRAQRIGELFAQNPYQGLPQITRQVVGTAPTLEDQQLLVIVFNRTGVPVYPDFKIATTGGAATRTSTVSTQATTTAAAQSIATVQANATATAQVTGTPSHLTPARATVTARATASAQAAANANSTRTRRNEVLAAALQLINPSLQPHDLTIFRTAVDQALNHRKPTDNEFGRDSPVGNAQPFSVRPITDGKRLVGVLVVTVQHADKIPAFVSAVGQAVLVASLVIAALAALAAIFFSQTITRPLAKLTGAARGLGKGNYTVQVKTRAPGELGELSHTFNEMAAQLNRDVEELRRQELWRRELIMSITHDLATPLTAIAGLGEALVDGVNQSREDYEATGRIIVRETLRLRRLVKDLHMMAKVEAGALQPQRKPVRLAPLVDEVLAVLAPEFERGRVEPVNAISYNLSPVQADPDMLTRVFSNLCDNALRHTPAGGSVIIGARKEHGLLIVSVTDTGEGIPEDALPRVFERFYRADSARQSHTGGSGLGLAIVRAIIEAHGGTVQAENAPGAGARISFTLPIPSEEPATPTLADETTLRIPKKGRTSDRKGRPYHTTNQR